MNDNATPDPRRALPSVDALLRDPRLISGIDGLSEAVLRAVVRRALAVLRLAGEPVPSADAALAACRRALLDVVTSRLVPVLNATGVILHTNLGRAPLSAAAAHAMAAAAADYGSLEADPAHGERASRQRLLAPLWQALLGCDDAVVVGNNAGAVLLTLAALASGGEVIVSRGEAVEIGGGFRIPELVRRSGARLVEVGTTNRTTIDDYAAAITTRSRVILRVHPSNFRIVGFTARPELAALASLARDGGLLLVDDVGSGALLDTTAYGLAAEPRPATSLASGASLVLFSTDKLIGGPQGGVIAGESVAVARVARHPLMRALRTDKVQLAGLEATLRPYLAGRAAAEIPIWRMIAASPGVLRERAERWRLQLGGSVEPADSTVGGGSLPGETLAGWALKLPRQGAASGLARRLRVATPAVWSRIQDGHVWLDPRTVLPEDDDLLVRTVTSASPG